MAAIKNFLDTSVSLAAGGVLFRRTAEGEDAGDS
jgi:hypothetical protein